MSTSGDISEAQRLFELVCDEPTDQQLEILREHTGDNEDLFQRIVDLLKFDKENRDSDFLVGDPLEELREATARDLELLQLTDSSDQNPIVPLIELGDLGDNYQLLKEIGRGGMGVVFEAQQHEPNRIVAIKMLLSGQFAKPHESEQLRREAHAAGGLQHPNIIKIYDVGKHESHDYIVMPLIQGTNLHRMIRKELLDASTAAELLYKIALAIQCAHDHNVVHADLKPSNILIEDGGNPQVIDFGLSRKPTGDDPTQHVQGTPGYMAPEHLKGNITRLVDIFGLGAILYAMLTGRSPYSKSYSAKPTRNQLPIPIRQLESSVPRDLETICMKCLQYDPARRYQSARDLADDLLAFQQGNPIAARPDSFAYRTLLLAKRHKMALTLATASTICLFLAVIGITYGVATSRQALEVQRESLIGEAIGRRSSREVGQRFETLDRIGRAAGLTALTPEKQKQLRDHAIAALALFDLSFDIPLATNGESTDVHPNFLRYATGSADGEVTIREIESGKRIATLEGNGRRVTQLRYSPDGTKLASVHASNAEHVHPLLQAWDLANDSPSLLFKSGVHGQAYDFDPRSDRLLYCSCEGGLYYRTLQADSDPKLLRDDIWVTSIAFHPIKNEVAIGRMTPNELWILDADDGSDSDHFTTTNTITSIAWRPDGRLLAMTDGADVELREMPSGYDPPPLRGHTSGVSRLLFNHRGDTLVSGDYLGQMHIWEPSSSSLIMATTCSPCLRFSHDDSMLAGARQTMSSGIWRVGSRKEYQLLKCIQDPKQAFANFPDRGNWCVSYSSKFGVLASSSIEGIHLWNPDTSSEPIGKLSIGHCTSCLFDTGGETLYTSGKSGVRRWPLSKVNSGTLRIGPAERLKWDPRFQGHQLSLAENLVGIVESTRKRCVFLDLRNSAPKLVLPTPTAVDSVAVAPDGRFAAIGTWNQIPRGTSIIDLESGERVAQLETGDAWPFFSPDGKWLVTGSRRQYQFWSVGDWKRGLTIDRNQSDLRGALAFSQDQSQVAIAYSAREVRIFDVTSGAQLAKLETRDKGIITHLTYSRDDTRLAASCQGRTIKIWNLEAIDSQLASLGLPAVRSNKVTAEPPTTTITKIIVDFGPGPETSATPAFAVQSD